MRVVRDEMGCKRGVWIRLRCRSHLRSKASTTKNKIKLTVCLTDWLIIAACKLLLTPQQQQLLLIKCHPLLALSYQVSLSLLSFLLFLVIYGDRMDTHTHTHTHYCKHNQRKRWVKLDFGTPNWSASLRARPDLLVLVVQCKLRRKSFLALLLMDWDWIAAETSLISLSKFGLNHFKI